MILLGMKTTFSKQPRGPPPRCTHIAAKMVFCVLSGQFQPLGLTYLYRNYYVIRVREFHFKHERRQEKTLLNVTFDTREEVRESTSERFILNTSISLADIYIYIYTFAKLKFSTMFMVYGTFGLALKNYFLSQLNKSDLKSQLYSTSNPTTPLTY